MRLSFAIALVLAGALSATAGVVNFDDIVTGGDVVEMPVGYAGISWNSTEFGVYGFPDGIYNPHSDPNKVLVNRLSSGPTEEITFSFSGPVTFNGAWFSGDGSPVHFNLYLGASLVGTSSDLATTGTPAFLDSGYGGSVDKVGIFGTRGFYVFDDVTFNASAVPEPSTFGALCIGAVTILILRRRARA
jgi:PEP-CTERM motif-containing protein